MINNPLVSIVVVTYNSSKTVLDTLDSIAAQTYNNLELIVSDDYSKDDTVQVVKTWIAENKKRFIRVQLLTVENNTGTVKNCNRGCIAAKGDWIKSIAGDDMLKSNCIQTFIEFTKVTPDCRMCCCDLDVFSTGNDDITKIKELYSSYFNHVREPQLEQWNRVKYNLTLPGPGYFYSRDLYEEVGGFDEEYILLEETPFVFNVLKHGYRIYPIDEKLVLYRISPSSVCRDTYSNTYKILLSDKCRFFKKHQLPTLLKSGMYLIAIKYAINYYRIEKEIRYGQDSLQAKLTKLLYFVSPLHYIDFFRRNSQ